LPPKPTSASGKPAARAKSAALPSDATPAPASRDSGSAGAARGRSGDSGHRAHSGAAANPGPSRTSARFGAAAATAVPNRICVRVGIGGPVGAGKTTLIAALCRVLQAQYALAVVSNELQTHEDADFLLAEGVLEPDRIVAVPTGCSPQTAIREDIAANLDAVEALEAALYPLDLLLVESGGGDLTTTFSRGLIDRQIFVLDTAAGHRTVRKGGPGIARADLLVVNKTDLAPLVGADLEAMRRGASDRREALPTLFTSFAEHPDVPAVADWIRGQIEERRVLLGRG
jgi:urease accessory protein